MKHTITHRNIWDTLLLTPQEIWEAYRMAYGSETQGCCLLIADEIQRRIGGEVVAGFLRWYGGSCKRSHWWVEKDGKTIDPMGDYVLSFEVATSRQEAHRDREQFESVLPLYEQYRIVLSDEAL